MTPDPEKLVADLRLDEGVRYVIYHDTKDHPSIGVGHNLDARPLPPDWHPPLTDAQVNALLKSDLALTYIGLDKYVGAWWRTLSEPRSRALANMAFNLGPFGLASFHQFIGFMRVGSYALAARDLTGTAWAQEVGERAKRIEALIIGG